MSTTTPLSRHPTLMAVRAELRKRGGIPPTERGLCELEVAGLLGLCIQSHHYEKNCPRTPERMEITAQYMETYRRTGNLPSFVEEVSKEIISGGRARLASAWIDSFCLMTEACDSEPLPVC